MDLIIVRHALPLRVEKESGTADPELSAEGHRQAELLACYLAHEHIDVVYSSPLARARQTASPLSSRLGLELMRKTELLNGTRTPLSTFRLKRCKL